jgi:hypothetical protein
VPVLKIKENIATLFTDTLLINSATQCSPYCNRSVDIHHRQVNFMKAKNLLSQTKKLVQAYIFLAYKYYFSKIFELMSCIISWLIFLFT